MLPISGAFESDEISGCSEVLGLASSTDGLTPGNKLLKVGDNDYLLFQQLLLTCQKKAPRTEFSSDEYNRK